MSVREPVSTSRAPAAIGPYSQAIKAGGFLFVSGQVALDPATGQLDEGDVSAQTRRVFGNLGAILEAAGASFNDVVKTTVYLKDMSDFGVMNEIYGTCFTAPYPARATIQAARLPKDVSVEIDLIALLP
jgi:2-iminobutanoate/2-iminopropanoate deaminase